MITLEKLVENNTYYESKIIYVVNEFKRLFEKMLKDKGIKVYADKEFFSALANKTKIYYPELEHKINSVVMFYGSEEDSEEKLYYLLKLYKLIKEKVYGK